jgi:hypothetical protein
LANDKGVKILTQVVDPAVYQNDIGMELFQYQHIYPKQYANCIHTQIGPVLNFGGVFIFEVFTCE